MNKRPRIIETKRALGEFAIIVAGVLSALGVEAFLRWSDERATEREYLTALLEEVVADPTLANTGSGNAARPLAWLEALEADEEQDPVRLLWELREATFSRTLIPSRGVFDELTSTGGLRLIKNIELRRRIVAYYGWLDHIQPLDDHMELTSSFDSRSSFVQHVAPRAWAIISSTVARSNWSPWSALGADDIATLRSELSGIERLADFEALRRDPEVLSNLAMISENGAVQEQLYVGVSARGRAVQRALRADLGLPHPQDEFWTALTSLCGQAFAGSVLVDMPPDPDFDDQPMAMHVRDCSETEIRIPFHVGDDRSRTWVVTRTETGLRLKHDHRHEDGSEDEVTQYGGDTNWDGRSDAQSFPADEFTAALVPTAARNIWAMQVSPGERFAYRLSRVGSERAVVVVFDLTAPIDTPPAPWGAAQ